MIQNFFDTMIFSYTIIGFGNILSTGTYPWCIAYFVCPVWRVSFWFSRPNWVLVTAGRRESVISAAYVVSLGLDSGQGILLVNKSLAIPQVPNCEEGNLENDL